MCGRRRRTRAGTAPPGLAAYASASAVSPFARAASASWNRVRAVSSSGTADGGIRRRRLGRLGAGCRVSSARVDRPDVVVRAAGSNDRPGRALTTARASAPSTAGGTEQHRRSRSRCRPPTAGPAACGSTSTHAGADAIRRLPTQTPAPDGASVTERGTEAPRGGGCPLVVGERLGQRRLERVRLGSVVSQPWPGGDLAGRARLAARGGLGGGAHLHASVRDRHAAGAADDLDGEERADDVGDRARRHDLQAGGRRRPRATPATAPDRGGPPVRPRPRPRTTRAPARST
jgi:hypothetical protein